MSSWQEIIDVLFGGQFDISKVTSLLVFLWSIVTSIIYGRLKKKFLASTVEENETQKQLKKARDEVDSLKECVSYLSDVVLTAYLSSNTIPEEVKKQLGYIGTKLDKVAGIDLKSETKKLIDVVTTVVPNTTLNEKREEIDANVELVEKTIDAANDVVQEAIDKIKLS